MLLHLSDLHFDGAGTNAAIQRAPEIAKAALGDIPGVGAVLCLVTGDLTDKGDPEGYSWVEMFFADLQDSLKTFQPNIEYLGEIYVPGNHDITRPEDAKDLFGLTTALTNLRHPRNLLGPGSVEVAIALEAQAKFFEFEKARTGRSSDSVTEKLSWVRTFKIDNANLEIVCLNTSFACLDEHDQGLLSSYWPEDLSVTDGSFRICLMHHPWNWLKIENGRGIQKHLQGFSDLVLSGHEHDGQEYVRHSKASGETIFFEADALIPPKGPGSQGFSTIALDFDTGQRRTSTFLWHDNRYVPGAAQDWFNMRRDVGVTDGFMVTDKFLDFLDDPGMSTGGVNGTIRLADVFVYPKLRDVTFETHRAQQQGKGPTGPVTPVRNRTAANAKGPQVESRPVTTVTKDETKIDRIIPASDAISKLATEPRMLVVGESKSGKTTLLRKLFADLRSMGKVPLVLCPHDLGSPEIDSVHAALAKRAVEQYGEGADTKFLQVPIEKRAILIDEFQEVKLKSEQLKTLLNSIESLSGMTILFGDELSVLRHVWAAFKDHTILNFRIYRMLPLDGAQQKEIARKVHNVQVAYTDDVQVNEALVQLERNLDGILGQMTVTPLPGDVKAIVRDLISQQTSTAEYGAFGFFYDRMVRNDLSDGVANAGKDAQEIQLNALMDFLTELSFTMYLERTFYVTDEQINQVIALFHKEKIPLERSQLLAVLNRARMIVQDDSGYKFRERYQRYYFMATRLKDMLGDEDTQEDGRAILMAMVETLHEQESADVILFTIYLTRSPWLMKQVITKAHTVLGKLDECDMSTSFDFAQVDKHKQKSELEIYEGIDVDDHHHSTSAESDDDLDEQLLLTIKSMSEAFNTINIIGQALRNYSTKIKLEIREGLAEECYGLALRALTAFIGLVEQGQGELISLARKHLKVNIDPTKENQLASTLLGVCSFGIVRRTTLALASPHLADTLYGVRADATSVSSRMIRTSLLLDLKRIEDTAVAAFYENLDGNPIARNVLTNVVVTNLRTFDSTHNRRQSLCAAVKVDPNMPALFGSPFKPRLAGEK
ncbi:MAG: metallophosphoesterase [Armatimonadetes bacterium]|nr:metallophosphoesterase [Armatimonadota bacterium]